MGLELAPGRNEAEIMDCLSDTCFRLADCRVSAKLGDGMRLVSSCGMADQGGGSNILIQYRRREGTRRCRKARLAATLHLRWHPRVPNQERLGSG